jgi:hypothetical protein
VPARPAARPAVSPAAPRLAVTVGDPRGIGPELVRQALAAALVPRERLLIVGPTGAGVDVDLAVGAWDPANGAAGAGLLAGAAVAAAVDCAQAGEVAGIVTAPLDKAALHAGGYDYPGHTEMLGALTGCPATMMLAADGPRPGEAGTLRVVLATTHVPLRDVPRLLTAGRSRPPPRSPATTCGGGSGSRRRASRSAPSTRTPATAAGSAARTTSCSPRPPAGSASPARSRPTPCSCAPCAAPSTP